MVSWEYEYIRHNLHKMFIDELNKAGAEGWELVSVEKDSQNYYMGFLKRQVHSSQEAHEEAAHESHEAASGEASQPEEGEKPSIDERERARIDASRLAVFNRIFNRDK